MQRAPLRLLPLQDSPCRSSLTIWPTCTFHTASTRAPSLRFITSRQHSSFRTTGSSHALRGWRKRLENAPLPCWFSPLGVWGGRGSGWELHSWAPPGSVHLFQLLCSQQPSGQQSGCGAKHKKCIHSRYSHAHPVPLHSRGFIHLTPGMVESHAWCLFLPELWPPGDWAEVPGGGRCRSRWPFVFAHFRHPSGKTEPTLCRPKSKGGEEEQRMKIKARGFKGRRDSCCAKHLLS